MNWHSIVMGLIALVCTLFSGVLLTNLPKLMTITGKGFDWLNAHTALIKNHTIALITQRALGVIRSAVLRVENDDIERIKADVKDGKIDPADLPKILADVEATTIKDIKQMLSWKGLLSALTNLVFNGSEIGMNEWIKNETKAAVSALPPSGLQTPKGDGTPSAVQQAQQPKKELSVPQTPHS